MLFIMLAFSVLFESVKAPGLGLGARYMFTMAIGRLLRAISFVSTILPSARPWCASTRFRSVPSYPHPWAQKYYVPYASDASAIRQLIHLDIAYGMCILRMKKSFIWCLIFLCVVGCFVFASNLKSLGCVLLSCLCNCFRLSLLFICGWLCLVFSSPYAYLSLPFEKSVPTPPPKETEEGKAKKMLLPVFCFLHNTICSGKCLL